MHALAWWRMTGLAGTGAAAGWMMAMLKNRRNPAPGAAVPGTVPGGAVPGKTVPIVVGAVLILLTAACSGGTLTQSTVTGTGAAVISSRQDQCGTVPTVAV